jgi:PhnB protein
MPKRKLKTKRTRPKVKRVKPIPDGYHTVTPYLIVRSADRAIDFYKRAFGARELMRMTGAAGKVMHAELKIGDSIVFLADEFPERGHRSPESLGGAGGSIFLYVRDVDAAFKRAVDAGARVVRPLADMFWGDRYGQLADPFGHEWGLGTHKEDLTPREIARRQEAFLKAGGQG